MPTSISRDEKVLLFTRSANGLYGGRDIWALPLSGEPKPYPVVETRYEEEEAVFSPDGNWISYHSNDLGSWQVYVDAFPTTGRPVRISTTSGYAATWSSDGKTVLYKSDGQIMAADLTFTDRVARPGLARKLFAPTGLGEDARSLDVDAKSGRFLLTTRQSQSSGPAPPLSVVQGWLARATEASRR